MVGGDLVEPRPAAADPEVQQARGTVLGELGEALVDDPKTKKDGPYYEWIQEYAGADFQQAVTTGRDLLERTVAEQHISEKRLEELTKIFGMACKLEVRSTGVRADPRQVYFFAQGHQLRY